VPMRARAIHILANGSLVFASTALVVLVAEVALHLFEPDYIPSARGERGFFSTFDRDLGWSNVANATGVHNAYDFSVVVHQNEFGHRGPDTTTLAKDPGRRRIAVFGDSYVWGFGVKQNEILTDPAVHGSRAELLNFGVSGYGTDQEYLQFMRDGLRFDPDEVVLVFTPYNDIENNTQSEQYGYPKPFFTVEDERLVPHTGHVKPDTLKSIKEFLRWHSRVVNVIDTAARRWQAMRRAVRKRAGASVAIERHLDESSVTEEDREGVRLTAHIIQTLRDVAEKSGAQFAVVFVPYKPHIAGNLPHNHPLAPVLAAELERCGINYFEPFPLFMDAAARGEALFNVDDHHFNAAGHREFAKALVDPETRTRIRNWYSADAQEMASAL